MLSALALQSSRGCGSAQRSDQASGPRARRNAGLEVAGRAEARTSASSPARGSASSLAATPAEDRPGEVVDRSGRRLGEHNGHHNFTVGQRRGLGVGGGEPLYVLASDSASNRVVAGSRDELATSRIRIRDAKLHRPAERVDGVRLRYHSPRRQCRVEVNGDPREAIVALAEPVDRVAPGQVACLLDGDFVVGHGTIV